MQLSVNKVISDLISSQLFGTDDSQLLSVTCVLHESWTSPHERSVSDMSKRRVS